MKTDSERKSEGMVRRAWLGSVATLAAVVVGAQALASRNPMANAALKADPVVADSNPNSGYQLTEHVKRYYATARV